MRTIIMTGYSEFLTSYDFVSRDLIFITECYLHIYIFARININI